jgi:hypothetical protein
MSRTLLSVILFLVSSVIQQCSIEKAFGQQGFALKFDGNDDYVSIPDSGDFDFGTAFTVEAWIMPLSLEPSGNFKAIVQGAFTEPPFSGGGWAMFLDNSDPSAFGLSVCNPNCNAAASDINSLSIGNWQHLAATYDGSLIRVYRNGAHLDSQPQYGDVTDINFVLLGIWESSFNGLMDEVRVWDIARSQAEIQANMNRILDGNEQGLVAYWNFNEGEGQVVSDVTVNQNDGRLGSTPAADDRDPIWVRVIPEPSNYVLGLLGFFGLVGYRWRNRYAP